MVRVLRPTSRISPPGPCGILTVAASQASRRAVSRDVDAPRLVEHRLPADGRAGRRRPWSRTGGGRPAGFPGVAVSGCACARLRAGVGRPRHGVRRRPRSRGNVRAVVAPLRFRRGDRVRSRGNVRALGVLLRRGPGLRRRSRGNAPPIAALLRPGRGRRRCSCANARAVAESPRFRRGLRRRSRVNFRRIRQGVRVHVHHHLIPVAGGSPVELGRQRAFGNHPQGISLPLRQRWLRCLRRSAAAGVRTRGALRIRAPVRPVRTARLVAGRLQRPPHDRPHLRRQTAPHHNQPVLVHPRPQRPRVVPPPVLRLLRQPVHAPPDPHDLLYVRRRARERHVQQIVFGLGRRDPGDGPHLRVGDPAAPHGVAQLGQVGEGAGDPHVFTGRARGKAGAPAQPLGAGRASHPAVALVELADQLEQLPRRRLNAGGELGDAVAEGHDLCLGTVGAPGPGFGCVARGHNGVCRMQRRHRIAVRRLNEHDPS